MRRAATGVVLGLLTASCASLNPPNPSLAQDSTGQLLGYLPQGGADVSQLLPPAPSATSALHQADQVGVAVARSQRDSFRSAQARADDSLDMLAAFAGPLGQSLTERQAPHTTLLMRRMLVDVLGPLEAAKAAGQRRRPIATFGSADICVPEKAADLAASHSYPSTHAAYGWATALLLAELLPEKADAILARGRDYGDSRVVCGVQYPSDVDAGRMAGAAILARLQANTTFQRDAAAARGELRRRLELTPRLLPEITPPRVRLPDWMRSQPPASGSGS